LKIVVLNTLAIILFLCLSTHAKGQTYNLGDVANEVIQFEDIEKDIFSKHESFKEAFKGKRIVVLAPANHGDGTSYKTISQLIKLLIDSLKFNTLAIEGGNLDVSYMQQKLIHDTTIKYITTYLNSHYFDAKYGFELLPFLKTKLLSKELQLEGLDFQPTNQEAIHFLIDTTVKLFPQIKYEINWSKFESLVNILWEVIDISHLTPEDARIMSEGCLKITNHFREKDSNLYRQLIRNWDNLDAFVRWQSKPKWNMSEKEILRVTNSYSDRDSVMAKNLIYYLDHTDPNAIIIVYVSAYHAMRKSYLIPDFQDCCKTLKVKTFGELMASSTYGKDIYSLAFIAACGERAVVHGKKFDVPKPVKGSLEYILNKKPINYGFVNFINLRDYKFQNMNFKMSPFFDKYFQGAWLDIYDGIFYIKKMAPNNIWRTVL